MLPIDRLIKNVHSVTALPDVVMVTTQGDGADIIYLPESGSIVDFLHSQKLNTLSRVENITVTPRISIKGKTIINNVAYLALKKELKNYEITKALPRVRSHQKMRFFDTSPYINEIISLAHTRSITSIYRDFFNTIFTSILDFNKTTIPPKTTKNDKTKLNTGNTRPKILLIDINLNLQSRGLIKDLEYFFKLNNYIFDSKVYPLLPDAVICKIDKYYFPLGIRETPVQPAGAGSPKSQNDLNLSSVNFEDTIVPNTEPLKINRMVWERISRITEEKSLDYLNGSNLDNSKGPKSKLSETKKEFKIFGFTKPKTLKDIEKLSGTLDSIRENPKNKNQIELIRNIKKFVESSPELEHLDGKTFQEKIENLYIGIKHAEKIRKGQSASDLLKNEDTITEELPKEPTLNTQEREDLNKFKSKLSKAEKQLVKEFNGTIFLEEMQERSNLGLRSYNPDNIVELTEFNGYKKQSTEFKNNLNEAIEDLIKSLEKDKDIGIKVLKVTSEIKDDNRTRYQEFTAQIQHSEFGNTYSKKYPFKLMVPFPVEDKYLKFGGNDYVMVNQLFNKPIQKVNNQLVRLYTHYNTTSVTLKNSKFNGIYGLENIEKELVVTIKNASAKLGIDIQTKDLNKDLNKDSTIQLEENENFVATSSIPTFLEYLPKSVREKFKYLEIKIDSKKPMVQWNLNFQNDKFLEASFGEDTSRKEYAKFNYETKEINYYVDGDVRNFPIEHIDEFLLGMYNKLSKILLKTDIIKKSKSSIPYVSVRIIGKQCPVAVMLVCMESFDKAMDRMDLRWSFQDKKIITKEKDQTDGNIGIGAEPINIQVKNGYITIYPKTFKQKILAAGLNRMDKNLIKNANFDPNSNDLFDEALAKDMGQVGFVKFKESIPKIIDNTTEKVLKEYGHPTDILTLYSDTMVSLLMSREDSHFENLDHYRIRLSEMISHIGYNQLQQALSELKRKKQLPDQKLIVRKDFIMNKLLEAGIFQNAKTINPIEEMMLSQKIVKTGIGNVKKEQVTLARRDLNPSYFGVISPTATNEYGGIGSNQTLTNGTTILDRYGSIKTKKFDNTDNPFNMLSPVESLTPFFEYDDTTRRIMGNQQTGQFTQLENPDEPLVQTGFESYVPFLVSERFTKKAKISGHVKIDMDSRIITITGTGSDLGKVQNISIKHAKSRTKRGVYLINKYTPLVSDNQNVKAGMIIAATDSLKSGKLAVGKNLVIAQMPYNGMNYEDGWVITNTVPAKYSNKYLQKITILIPEKTKILRMNIDKNKMTNSGEILLEFQKEDYYIQNLDLDTGNVDENEDVLYGLEQHRGTSKYFSPGGRIAEIVVKLNNPKADPKIKALWEKSIQDLKLLQSKCQLQVQNVQDKKEKDYEYMECMGNTDGISTLKIGGHKIAGEEPGTGIIEIYIERENPIDNGSKFTLGNSGGKGTVQYIIPKGLEPYTMETGLKIDFLPTSLSIIKRKNPSIIFNMYLGKCLYFINEIVKGMIKNNPNDIDKVKDFVILAMRYIDKTKDHKIINEVETFFKNNDKNKINKAIMNSDSLSKPFFVGIVPPFMNKLTMKDIVLLAKHIGIPLKEKIIIPENDNTPTMKKVPVGILNVYLLEHFPQTQGSVRGSQYVKNSIVTGQGSSGSKDRKGATKAGLYDLYSILTKTPYNLIKELHSLKSDAKTAKMAYQREIFNGNGTPSISNIKITKDDTTTKNYIEALLLGAGLRAYY